MDVEQFLEFCKVFPSRELDDLVAMDSGDEVLDVILREMSSLIVEAKARVNDVVEEHGLTVVPF